MLLCSISGVLGFGTSIFVCKLISVGQTEIKLLISINTAIFSILF